MYKCCCLSRLVGNIVYCIIFCFTFCLVSMDGAFTFILGTQDSTQWDSGAGSGTNPIVKYSSGDKKVEVELICVKDTPDTLVALGENPQETYKFQLTGQCACWNGCKGKLFSEKKIF